VAATSSRRGRPRPSSLEHRSKTRRLLTAVSGPRGPLIDDDAAVLSEGPSGLAGFAEGYVGPRKGSIPRLEAGDYLNEPGVLRVIQKGGGELKIPMTPPVAKILDGLGIAAVAGGADHAPVSEKGVGSRLRQGRALRRGPGRLKGPPAGARAGAAVVEPDGLTDAEGQHYHARCYERRETRARSP
jgi:hypothetical protein